MFLAVARNKKLPVSDLLKAKTGALQRQIAAAPAVLNDVAMAEIGGKALEFLAAYESARKAG